MKNPNVILTILIMINLSIGCKDKQPEGTVVEENYQSIADTVVPKLENKKVILFFGNSLTAGYGLDESQSFPSLIQNRLDSLGLAYQVVNAGLSGETSAGGLNRIDWVLRQTVDLFVLELGANDALRGLDVNATDQNLRGILDKVRVKFPHIPLIIAGMKAPRNMGSEYTEEFDNIFPNIASDYQAGLIPFLLYGVATNPRLNLADGIHPNIAGQKIVMENVWKTLVEYLE